MAINVKSLGMARMTPLLLLILLVIGCSAASADEFSLQAEQGVLQLKEPLEGSSVSLDGEWSFYWMQFVDRQQLPDVQPDAIVKVPAYWNDYRIDGQPLTGNGYATYVLKVTNLEASHMLEMKVPPVFSASKIWVNGELLAETGEIGTSKEQMRPVKRVQTVYFAPNSSELTIVIQISNFSNYYGGLWQSVQLRDVQTAYVDNHLQISAEMFLTGALTIMALYHFGLFAMRRQEIAPLYFGAYTLLAAVRGLFVGETLLPVLFPNLNWLWAMRIEYICVYLSLSIFTVFLHGIYPREMSRLFRNALVAVSLLFTLVTLVTDASFFTWILKYYTMSIPVTVIYCCWVFAMAVVRKREGAVIHAVGGSVFAITTVNDVLFYLGIVKTGEWMYWGLFVFIFAQAMVLSGYFSRAFSQSEELASKLTLLNNTLEEKVKERTVELEQANLRLTEQSLIDGLTSIPNRRCFNELSERLWRLMELEQSPLSMMLIDIDHFKAYNDDYGHLFGDDCLTRVADVLNRTAIEAGAYAFRYGGEEFAVLLAQPEDRACELAERLVQAVAAEQIEHRASVTAPHVTISCGLAVYRHADCGPLSSIIEEADKALYQAKQQGRNRVFRFGE